MIKLSQIFLFTLILSLNAYSQGFDWQYSARMPSDSPTMFIGITGEFNYQIHSGSFNFLEQQVTCVQFNNGKGYGYSAGISGEYWNTGVFAIFGNIIYSNVPGKFAQTVSIQKVNYDLISEYDYNSNISYASLEGGLKWRLFESHLYIGCSLQFAVLVSNKEDCIEKIIGPDNAPPFNTNPPSYQRVISDGGISDQNPFNIIPKIRIGYDLPIGLGMYASPSIIAGFSILPIAKDSQWRRFPVSFGITFYKGIL
ncbi:MAG: hypothetical protein ABSG15_00025 [FCB group bacterium]|jgi:hypothetical protein